MTDPRRRALDRRTAVLDDRVVLTGLLLLAALLRLPDLATRGTWDGDQGHDMLVLRTFVRDGVLPLLGPPTSIGDVHHGAWYYYLLSPAAAVTGGNAPLAVVTVIALAGIAAVGLVWWLGRAIGGPVAGLVAGLLMATSAAAIDESTFIWNPNLIALSSALALAAAWHAWCGGDGRWWLVAAIGTAVTMQCHVLGVALLPVVGVPFVLDARRRPVGTVAAGIAAIFLAAYTPLIVNELTTGFSEVSAAVEYVRLGRGGEETPIPIRFGIVALRVLSWPLTGLIVDGFVAGVIAAAGVIAIFAWRWRSPRDAERQAVRWLGLGLLWSVLFLTVAAPSLAAVVRGLPNDHYHAFADPMVFVLVGLGGAGLVREARPPVGWAVVAVGVAALLAWNVAHVPPPVHPDGGFPAGEKAARRVDAALSGAGVDRAEIVVLRSLPEFKSTEALAYPLVRLGRSVHAETPEGSAPGSVQPQADRPAAILLCDSLFRAAIRADCGGPAEDAAVALPDASTPTLLDRFEAAPGRWMSVYLRTSG